VRSMSLDKRREVRRHGGRRVRPIRADGCSVESITTLLIKYIFGLTIFLQKINMYHLFVIKYIYIVYSLRPEKNVIMGSMLVKVTQV
jgi:hypothetical protein